MVEYSNNGIAINNKVNLDSDEVNFLEDGVEISVHK
jgi:hypothetical protein